MQEGLTTRSIQESQVSLWLIMLALTMSLILLHAVGFSQNHVLHETFHDLRHAMGFACH